MASSRFWLVMDEDWDGVAETVIPTNAVDRYAAAREALEFLDGQLMGVIHQSHDLSFCEMCQLCTAAPYKGMDCLGTEAA